MNEDWMTDILRGGNGSQDKVTINVCHFFWLLEAVKQGIFNWLIRTDSFAAI